MRFEGTDTYVATDDLKLAVNAALALERPLLIKGEPGTGKTLLAEEVARALGRPLHQWHIKSTTKAQQGLYEYDAVSRLRDSQLGDGRVADIAQLHQARRAVGGVRERGAGGRADRRDRQGRHRVSERPAARARPDGVLRLRDARRRSRAKHRPLVVITSNNEKELPDAFLRRCFFHYIRFPDRETMTRDRRRALSRAQEGAAAGGARGVLRPARRAGAEEEAVDVRAARLAEAAARRGHSARGAAQQRQEGVHSAAARRAAQERAGRAPVRARRVHGARGRG